MRYRLRTLVILLTIGPPTLAQFWLTYERHRVAQRQQEEVDLVMAELLVDTTTRKVLIFHGQADLLRDLQQQPPASDLGN